MVFARSIFLLWSLCALHAFAQNVAESPPFYLNTWWQTSAPNESGLFSLSTTGAQPSFCEVGGIVRDAVTQETIAGAEVQILPLEQGGWTNSAPDGSWSITVLGANGFSLHAEAEGYEALELYNLSLPAGQSVMLDLELEPLGLDYSQYRLRPLAQAPNPDPILIPEGGNGYAWFVVEGQSPAGGWLPVPYARVEMEDAQGTVIESQANQLNYGFLPTSLHLEHNGAVGLRIPADLVGSGMPGHSESLQVLRVNDLPLEPAERITLQAAVTPFEYSAEWGYRLYGKGGVGATAGVATATGFAGGGSGATFALDLEGLEGSPGWSRFRIQRRTDLFLGLEVELGPPTLVDLDITPRAEVTASFPYQEEYEFALEELQGLEALVAFYLFMEPGIIAAGGTNPISQTTIKFLSCMVETLMENPDSYNFGGMRLGDETGLDIEGSVGLGIGDEEFLSSMFLSMSPGISLGGHLGTSLYQGEDGLRLQRLYVGGGYEYGAGLKFQLGPVSGGESFFPHDLAGRNLPSSLDVSFELLGAWQDGQWERTRLTAGLESGDQMLNLLDLPGQRQAYDTWIEIDDQDLHNFLQNATELPGEMLAIGQSALSVTLDDADFKTDLATILEQVHEQQSQDLPVLLDYGLEATDKTSFELDLEFEFPGVLGFLVIEVGGGIQANTARAYPLAEGQWVKGKPYLHQVAPQPPDIALAFPGVLQELWDRLLEGELYEELGAVVWDLFWDTLIFWDDAARTGIALNERGSTLQLRAGSIPAGLDSAYCRNWEWDSNRESAGRGAASRERIHEYNRVLRERREEALGLHYGIGGFFRFEPAGTAWEDSTLLSIAYADSEVVGFAEEELALFAEDSLGQWYMLPSLRDTEANTVSAWIPDFRTYTLAPRLPQGEFGLHFSPDSLAADGVAQASLVTDSLFNNDGTLIADGTLFTLQASRGTLLDPDMDETRPGLQLASVDGRITAQIQADQLALPIDLQLHSVKGFARASASLPCYDIALPEAPQLLSVQAEHQALRLTWEEAQDPDIAGYHIWWDTDQPGPPWNGQASVWGESCPITVGLENSALIPGLSNDSLYYVAVTAFDLAGRSSEDSITLAAQPGLRTVESLQIQWQNDAPRLSWQAVLGASRYRIEARLLGEPDEPWMELAETSSLFWSDSDAGPARLYRVIVLAN